MKLRITSFGADAGCAILIMALLFGFFCLSIPIQAANKTSWSLFSQNAAGTNGNGEIDSQELMLLPKHIYISLKYQELRYYSGQYLIDDFLVSTGVPGKDTPTGEFSVLKKVPTVLYQGPGYYFPNTKWNLMFKPSYYIHGAYWHSNFGNKMSHGCVNVSYQDVEPLYNWADVGTPVTIFAGDFPTSLPMDLPSNTLIQTGQTIYLIMNGKKYGFTNMAVFTGLGYSLNKVQKGSTAGIPEDYSLDSGNIAHLAGSWLINGNTVYYATDTGLIPVSTWEIFLSNASAGTYLLDMNASDAEKQILPLMAASDPRVDQ